MGPCLHAEQCVYHCYRHLKRAGAVNARPCLFSLEPWQQHLQASQSSLCTHLLMDVQPRLQRAPYRSYLNAKSAGRKQDAGGQDAGTVTLADLSFAVPDVEHPRRVVATLPATNVNAKAALLAEHIESFWKWRFQLRRGHNICGCVCLMGPITQNTSGRCEGWSRQLA